jgi:hypothetical protein
VKVPPMSMQTLNIVFTPLENPDIYGGDGTDRISIPCRKGGVKAPSFLPGFTPIRLDPQIFRLDFIVIS